MDREFDGTMAKINNRKRIKTTEKKINRILTYRHTHTQTASKKTFSLYDARYQCVVRIRKNFGDALAFECV